ncbi:MAG: substrate-binding domain-containing protein, partial [Thermodesulfobacteriota bacterium]
MNKSLVSIFFIAFLAAVSLSIQSCSDEKKEEVKSDSGQLKGKLVLTGSSTVAPLAAEIGKRFEAQHPDVRIDVQTGGSSRGVADARQELADIGMVSRAL